MFWPFNSKTRQLTKERDAALRKSNELLKQIRELAFKNAELQRRNNQLAAELRGDKSWQAEKRLMSARVPTKGIVQANNTNMPSYEQKTNASVNVSTSNTDDNALTGVVLGAELAVSVMDEPGCTTDSTCTLN